MFASGGQVVPQISTPSRFHVPSARQEDPAMLGIPRSMNLRKSAPGLLLLLMVVAAGWEPSRAGTGTGHTPILDESICDGPEVPRSLRGTCLTYCETLDCDGAGLFSAAQRCDSLLQTYVHRSGGLLPPCLSIDSDGDGTEDVFDNCPAFYNPGQRDADEDGRGNGCDNCEFDPNFDQADADHDGLGDACDSSANPILSDVVVTAGRRHAECAKFTSLCCVDPPYCSCCCVPDQMTSNTTDIDLVTVTARASSSEQPLVLFLRFLEPPEDLAPPGQVPRRVTFEMFDVGPAFIDSVLVDIGTLPIVSGDEVAGDGIFTRSFYFATPTSDTAFGCVQKEDMPIRGATFSFYQSPFEPGTPVPLIYDFQVQAVDGNGSIDTGGKLPFTIKRTSVVISTAPVACGPPTGNGGCLPGSGALGASPQK